MRNELQNKCPKSGPTQSINPFLGMYLWFGTVTEPTIFLWFFKVFQHLCYTPLWKVIKEGKKLAKNEENPCLICFKPISSQHYSKFALQVPVPRLLLSRYIDRTLGTSQYSDLSSILPTCYCVSVHVIDYIDETKNDYRAPSSVIFWHVLPTKMF